MLRGGDGGVTDGVRYSFMFSIEERMDGKDFKILLWELFFLNISFAIS